MFPAQFNGVSGLEVRVEAVINYLIKKSGWQIVVFVRQWAQVKKNNKNNIKIKTIRIWTINNKYLDTIIYSFIASVKVLFLPVTLVCYEGTGSTLFCFLPRLFGKRVITTVHALEWQRKKWPVAAKLVLKLTELIALVFSEKIITVSQEIQTYCLRRRQKAVIFIPYYLRTSKSTVPKIIQRYGLVNQNYILYLGRFVPEKRIEWLVNAYRYLQPKQYLVLAGGSSHSHRYVYSLQELADGEKKIIFTGYVFGREKDELLANCALFILPSQTEGLSVAVLEALGHRRPVLVADTIDSRGMIRQSRFLFRQNDYYDFFKKFRNLLQNSIKTTRLVNYQLSITAVDFFHRYENTITKAN